ncbi:alpha/beta hydrolase family esterase [Photobacterium sp. TY1-4]|uniref:alpha/beta hydrolase family esterase n=1 Tax=Photobacterium sp. TY1-4 TaxID=2899122 RepID=UPI0021C1F0AF|nr:PHB depolymerase family esterase [Photobacterium sp. TY1-4]UXI04010.1 prolyl oligopeptidase family serine peptidase [Photobacterium sp. TY1-4]
MKHTMPFFSNLNLRRLFIALFMVSTLAAAAPDPGSDLSRQTITVKGIVRDFYLHLPPPDKTSTSAAAVVIALHGGGRTDGDELAQRAGFERLAAQDGMIIVYPNGITAQWNDGREKAARRSREVMSVDDVGFLSALIEHLVAEYHADPKRIFMMGLSNGGMMTLRMGCEASEKLAAIAPVIANMPANLINRCTPKTSLPVLLMNGTADPLVPWSGGDVGFLTKKMGKVASTDATLEFWLRQNHCDPLPSITIFADINTDDHSRVRRLRYQCQPSPLEVVLYQIEGGGHNFPGSRTPDLPRLLGPKNMDIHGAQEIWQFFKQHGL